VEHIERLPVVRPFIAPEEIARKHAFDRLLRLGANESAFGPAPGAIEAMRREAPAASLYGDPESVDLRARLALKHRCLPENIVVGAGIDDLMGLAVRAFAGEGGVAVATLGTYPTFSYHVDGYGARLETVAYNEDGSIDAAGLLALARRTRADIVYVANPDNPSGSLLAPAEIARIADGLPGETMFILDEAYADFAADAIAQAGPAGDRVIRLRTFSKAYGLAGMRIGYAIAGRRTIETFGKIRLQYGVSRLAQAAAQAALADDTFLRDVVTQTALGRAAYRELGDRLGLPVLPSHANFVLFDAGTRERASALLQELERGEVFIRKPGAPPLDRCIRVTVGTPDERARFAIALERAMEAV
jgi:histidinol-phosphate aminotransferase